MWTSYGPPQPTRQPVRARCAPLAVAAAAAAVGKRSETGGARGGRVEESPTSRWGGAS
ncbi:hypothetical protein [Oryza sativa Japonica Group]|uniref:Uncharacterized protein n=2 Tax=Oryza sativa subsp. japonica TaxID=39947 RepID=Q5NB78_ORYSJ|nr:hypothetical protein [Oryza sativa Japonica Group]BAD81472.1 hypothetical protein [Oryza sativa Japonica Group]